MGKALGIDEVVAGGLPDQKAATVRPSQAAGHLVAMAGDGVNDAPALAQAHVGIAVGTGLFLAFVYNLLGVPLAAGVPYPCFGIPLSPMLAALAMSLSSLSVIVNALRLPRLRR